MKQNNNVILKTETHQSTIAILQLTRFGDLIQTAQAISELKIQYPEYRVVLIAREKFAKPLEFIFQNLVDKIYFLNTQQIFNNAESLGLNSAVSHLNKFLLEFSGEAIDVLVNLSFSKSSAYLSTLIKSKHKIGAYFDFNNRMCIDDKWSQMLFSTVMRGSLNPFSLVDLFRNIIGIKPSAKSSIVNFDGRKKNIIIHPFAS